MDRTDQQLLDSARAGDSEALGTLLEKWTPAIRRKLRISRYFRSMIEVDDVLQVSYLEAFQQIRDFRGDANSFPRWFAVVASNNLRDAIDCLKRDKRPNPRRRLLPPAGFFTASWLGPWLSTRLTSPSAVAALAEWRRVIESQMQCLPRDYAQVLRLLYYEGLPPQDAAAIMGRTRGAIHLLRIRAVRRLQQTLRPESVSPPA